MSYKQALQENNIDLQSLLEAVNELPDQVSLPTLSNPASPSEILNGYEAIGEDGAVIEGTALETASTATAADIMSGKTAYNSAGVLLTGTMAKGLTVTRKTATCQNGSSVTVTTGAYTYIIYHMKTSGGTIDIGGKMNGTVYKGAYNWASYTSTGVKLTMPNFATPQTGSITVWAFN